MAEFPHLLDLYDEYQELPIQILSINPINRNGKVKSDAQRFELPFPVLVGRGSDILKTYVLKGLPRIVIIDAKGKVVAYEKFLEYEDIKKSIDALISQLETKTTQEGD